MPDGWSWKVDDKYWDLRKLAETEFPGLQFVRATNMTTGLWRDVIMRDSEGKQVERRIFF